MQKTKASQSTNVKITPKKNAAQGSAKPSKSGTVGNGNMPTGKTKTVSGKKY